MFQPRGSCLGSERCFGRKVVVEAAVSEACGLHQIGHADAVEAMLAKQSTSCLDDALAILCGLLFGQFHCASSRKMNSLLDIIMLSVITLYIQRGRLSLLRLRSPRLSLGKLLQRGRPDGLQRCDRNAPASDAGNALACSPSCLDDALAISCGLLFSQFHCTTSKRTNFSSDIIMMYVIILSIQCGRLSLLSFVLPFIAGQGSGASVALVLQPMNNIKAYAAITPRAPLEPFSFDLGEIGPEEVEIKVTHCGICHSDLSMLDNEWGMSKYPLVPGHEAVGTVVDLGEQAKGLKIGQRVGVGWSAYSCLSCHECLSGDHNLCLHNQGTIVRRHGGFADSLRVQWTWARPLPDSPDPSKTGPLLCGGVTVFSPLLQHKLPSTARVGIIGIGGLGHMALQFANKWGFEVHAFTTSDDKEAEARQLGAHFVHNTKREGALKSIARSLDLILSTVNVPLDIPALLETLGPKGRLHVVGAILKPMEIPAFGLIMGQKSVTGSPVGSPTAIDRMLAFSARHSIAPVVEFFPISKVNDAFEHLRSGK